MLITDWRTTERDESREVSATVDGFRLWYRVPKSFAVSGTWDPFLAAALLPAMLRGEPLKLDPGLTVSSRLLKNMEVLQGIHSSWNPVFKVIPIEARVGSAEPLNPGVMAFFSGGVDSTYTFLKRRPEISHLVYIQGFDYFAGVGDGTAFGIGDIADLAQIAYKLDTASGPLSEFLKTRLSRATQAALPKYRMAGSGAGELEKDLAGDLCRIVGGPSIFQERLFAGLRLRPETLRLLSQGGSGEDTPRLNRLLLEDAYPLEIARRDGSIFGAAAARNGSFAGRSNRTLIPAATNFFPFGYRYNLSRNLSQGSALASVALLLGFPLVFVPSSYSYGQLFPLGSHPLTDPLWGTEATEIIHDGSEARRLDKVRRIVEDGPALANLRVCFNDANVNCGHCLKCLRTMISLRLLQAGTGPFPALPSNSAIRKLRIAGDIEKSFFQDNLELARHSRDEGLRGALQACLKRQERQDLFKDFDSLFLGGLFKRIRRRASGPGPGFHRIDTTAAG